MVLSELLWVTEPVIKVSLTLTRREGSASKVSEQTAGSFHRRPFTKRSRLRKPAGPGDQRPQAEAVKSGGAHRTPPSPPGEHAQQGGPRVSALQSCPHRAS